MERPTYVTRHFISDPRRRRRRRRREVMRLENESKGEGKNTMERPTCVTRHFISDHPHISLPINHMQ